MLAVALAVARLPSRMVDLLHHLDDLVRRLRAAEATGRFNRQLQAFLRPAVLVVDEVGYLPFDRAEANLVFQLVSRRYERGTMILTIATKASPNGASVLGDDVLATAILDRLLHHCDVININGPSFQRRRADPGGERLAASGQPVGVGLARPARHQVQQPCLRSAVAPGQVHDPGEFLRSFPRAWPDGARCARRRRECRPR